MQIKEFTSSKNLPSKQKVELSFIWFAVVLLLIGTLAFSGSGGITGFAVVSNATTSLLSGSVLMWSLLLATVVIVGLIFGRKH
jgi:hypothetical protein